MKVKPLAVPSGNAFQSAVSQVQACSDQLNELNFERKREIVILFLALIARKNCCFLSAPGNGKSRLAEQFSVMIDDSSFFAYLMQKATTPEELFGMWDLMQLKTTGSYVRKLAGKLADTEVAFIDEIWKGSSSINNSLLTAINERKYDNGDAGRTDIPLEMVVAASNEMPKLEGDESCAALWDRFPLRRWVEDVQDEDNLLRLIRGEHNGSVTERLSRDQIEVLRVAANSVDVSAVEFILLAVKAKLATDHGIRISGRKLVQATEIVRAAAVLSGRMAATPEDVLVLEDCLWEQPADAVHVRAVVAELAGGNLLDAMKCRDAAIELWTRGVETGNDAKPRHLTYEEAIAGQGSPGEGAASLAALNTQLKSIISEMSNFDASMQAVADMVEEVQTMQRQCARAARRILGV